MLEVWAYLSCSKDQAAVIKKKEARGPLEPLDKILQAYFLIYFQDIDIFGKMQLIFHLKKSQTTSPWICC